MSVEEYAIIGVVAALVLAVGGLLLRRHFKVPKLDRQLRRLFRKSHAPYLHDVLLPDGMDGQIHLDYLVLGAGGLYVIDVKPHDGLIFGADRMDQWAQVKGMRTYRFQNPLTDNMMRIGSIRSLVPQVPVQGRVVFPDAGDFPKGVPEGVATVASLSGEIGREPGTEHAEAWEVLNSQAVRSRH